MEILTRCEPSGVMRLLSTSKMLTNIANENETTIYRKLYHDLRAGGVAGAHVVHSPVWKKGNTATSYPLSAALPAPAVYSWKVRYRFQSLVDKCRGIDHFPLFFLSSVCRFNTRLRLFTNSILNLVDPLHRQCACVALLPIENLSSSTSPLFNSISVSSATPSQSSLTAV